MTGDTSQRNAVIIATGCDLSWLSGALGSLGWSVCTRTIDEAAQGYSDPVDLIVHCHLPSIDAPVPIASISADGWDDGAMRPMVRTLATLRAAPGMLGGRGAVVGLGPAFALQGTAGLCALAAAAEGQRTLVKAIARQWLSGSIVSNWVSIATEMLLPALAAVPNLTRYSVGSFARRLPDAARIAALVDALAGSAGHALAGQTLIADGGDWMTP